jgi:hypothetical protein
MRKLIALALSTIAGVGAVAGLAADAGATTTYTGTIKQPTTSFVAPSRTTAPVHYNLQANEQVETHCFREGDVINGSPYWFIIEKNGQTGYVHLDAISVSQELPHC